MSSNPNFNAPVLSYVGSVDIATASYGSTLYNILFDASLCTIGNILMFEYKIQPSNVLVPDINNITLGYVNVENAIFNSGIGNQWTISVPAMDNVYNPTVSQQISVRVYSGLTNSTEIAVTQWSNSLDVHDPPEKPVITTAFFDDNLLSQDDLWVVMDINTTYNYNEVQFIVAYYFQDPSGQTIWGVSDPQNAQLITYNGSPSRLLFVNNIGHIDDYYNTVYVSVYAVYPFTYSGNKYYSVSEVSTTEEAIPASDYSAPTITNIDYKVYVVPPTQPTIPGNQTMEITWTAPATSLILPFTVNHYVLQSSANSGSWVDLSNNISANTLTYNVDVSSYSCGTNLSFRVFAISTTGQESLPSNIESKNIFKYSNAPQNLTVVSTSSSGTTSQDITISFNNPTDIGCGAGYRYEVTFLSTDGMTSSTKYITYVAGSATYTESFTSLPISTSGTVTVSLQTIDTNSPVGSPIYRNGISTSTPYITTNLVLNDVDYQIYTDPNKNSQNMILTWNDIIFGATGWSVNYNVELSTGGAYSTIYTGTSTTYTYTATQSCGTTLTFRVTANLTHSPSGVTFTKTSNNEQINIFKYATPPSSVLVNWASTDISSTLLDLSVTFTVPNPYDIGCGSAVNWNIQVLDSNGTQIGNIATTPYNSGQTIYTLFLNNYPYILSGSVKVYLVTTDTNGNGNQNGKSTSGSFTSSGLPIITDISNNGTALTFDVYSQVALAYVGRFLYISGNPPPNAITDLSFFTNNHPVNSYEFVTITTTSNNVVKYSYTFYPSFFSQITFPNNLLVAVSNNVGISIANIS